MTDYTFSGWLRRWHKQPDLQGADANNHPWDDLSSDAEADRNLPTGSDARRFDDYFSQSWMHPNVHAIFRAMYARWHEQRHGYPFDFSGFDEDDGP